jgi:hypothetical protein
MIQDMASQSIDIEADKANSESDGLTRDQVFFVRREVHIFKMFHTDLQTAVSKVDALIAHAGMFSIKTEWNEDTKKWMIDHWNELN